MRRHVAEAQAWASKALRYALAAGRTREATQAAGDLFAHTIEGPLPFARFAATAQELLSTGEPISGSVGLALMAVAALAAGDDSGFHEHEGRWRDVLDRHGLAWLAAVHGLSIAYVEISVGKAEAAERRLREAREFLAPIGNTWWVDLVDGYLCEAVGAQDRPREFLRLADAFATSIQMTDRETLIRRQLLLARAHLLRGSAPEAEAAARRALKLVEPTDDVPEHAKALLLLAEVLDERDLGDDAAVARRDAIVKLRAKGNLAAVAHLSG